MNRFIIPFLIVVSLVGMSYCTYQVCKERHPTRIGTVEINNISECVSSYQTCTYSHSTKTNSCTTHCSEYVCQQVTVKIGKHFWNDETLNVKDLYRGECRTKGGGW